MTGKEGVDEVFDIVGPADGDIVGPADGDIVGPADGDRVGPADDGEPVTIVVRVHVTAGAGRTAVTGRHGDGVKFRVAAPPEGGRANDAVAALLATTLGVNRDQVSLVAGAASRSKRFRVEAVELDAVRRLLSEAMAGRAGRAGRAGGAGGAAGNARGRRGVR